jgi:hypothetical protein
MTSLALVAVESLGVVVGFTTAWDLGATVDLGAVAVGFILAAEAFAGATDLPAAAVDLAAAMDDLGAIDLVAAVEDLEVTVVDFARTTDLAAV